MAGFRSHPKRNRSFRPGHSREGGPSRRFDGRKEITGLYGRTWEEYREVFLAVNGTCYACGKKATVVDHLVPHKGDKALFEKTDNHIPLCAPCHNTVTAFFDRNFTPGASINDKLTWLKWERARNSISSRVKVLPRYGR